MRILTYMADVLQFRTLLFSDYSSESGATSRKRLRIAIIIGGALYIPRNSLPRFWMNNQGSQRECIVDRYTIVIERRYNSTLHDMYRLPRRYHVC